MKDFEFENDKGGKDGGSYELKRRYIDWEMTSRNLELLRNDNLELRRRVCRALNYDERNCSGNCGACRYDMDTNISRAELAQVFNVTANVIFNWERGITHIEIDDLLFYCQLAGVTLEDIIVFR